MKRENKISFYDIEDVEKIGKIDNINCHAKNFLNLLFESIPFLVTSYQKYKDKKLKPEKFVKRGIAVGIFMVIVLVIEYFYFQSVFENIIDISENVQNGNQIDTNVQANETITNEIENNITNEEQANEITNTIANEAAVPYVNREE